MKVPKIRFKGFEGDWDIKNLWNNSKISTWTCVTDKETSDNYKYPVISGWKDIMWYYFEYNRKPNTITIARAWTAWFVQLIKSPFYLNDKCFSVIPNNEIFNTNFLFFSLKNSEKNIMNLRSSTSVPTINTQHLNSLQISLPSLPEQEKIWSLFEQLDSHISKNQQKLEKLKNMKQSFLQKLFPKDWSALPELRFKGFEGAWEERKLGEIADEIGAWWDINKNLIKDVWKYPVFANALTNEWIVWFYEQEYKVKAPALTITWRWDVGKAKARIKNFTPVVRLLYIKTQNNVFFLENNINRLKIAVESTWIPQLTKPQIENITISLPSLPEQEKIWAFFEKLDTQITQQTQKIEKLKNIKQSLLEKMFI